MDSQAENPAEKTVVTAAKEATAAENSPIRTEEPLHVENHDAERDAARADARLRRRIGSAESVSVRLDFSEDRSGSGESATADRGTGYSGNTSDTDTARRWEGLAAALISGDHRIDRAIPYAVLGGPGTGKTSLLLDTLVAYLRAGGDPEGVMVITPSKEAATDLRTRLTEVLRGQPDYASTGTPVRSVHSWAFALVRAVAQRRAEPLPRLMTGADHDVMIRELLRGHAEDGGGAWPEQMRPALTLVGFARQLRDLLLRAGERGVGPRELTDLGHRFGMDMWAGAGHFLEEIHQVERLANSHSLNASDLLHRALDDVENTADGAAVLDEQRRRIRLLLVDDAHNLDPASARLIGLFTVPGATTVVSGDPDQCVFHFRGADEDYLSEIAANPAHRVVLSQSHRVGPATVTAINRLERRLPALPTRIPLRGGAITSKISSDLVIRRAPSATAGRLSVADEVRRAHIVDGVNWDQIAVIVRTAAEIHGLRRTLLSHGVPVKVDPTSVVLAEQPLVAAFLMAVEALTRPLTPGEFQQLMESPVGGADPVMVRRMERAIAPVLAGTGLRSMEAVKRLATGVAEPEEREEWNRRLGPRERELLDHISEILQAGRKAHDSGASVEAVLWALWQATGLSTRLQTRALRGGTLGSQADRDLDAMMSLFDFAGDLVERTPAMTLGTFLDAVRAQELPTGARDRRGARPDAVEILPAHAAAGREWKVVVVSGVQEDSWPAGPTVGGLFGQQDLVDLIDRGIEPHIPLSRAAGALAEERRLFLLAISRASLRTVVTAVESLGDEALVPSRFLDEILHDSTNSSSGSVSGHAASAIVGVDPVDPDEAKYPGASPVEFAVEALPRVLAMEPLVAELRDAVCDPGRPGHERHAAAMNLGVLAEAGVFGADPTQWWGTALPSSAQPAVAYRKGDPEPTIRISPTMLENLGVTLNDSEKADEHATGCDFATFLGGLHGTPTTEAMKVGTLIHAIAEGFVTGLSMEDAKSTIHDVVPWIINGPDWTARLLIESCVNAVDRLYHWLEERSTSGRTVEVEKRLEHQIGYTDAGEGSIESAPALRVVLVGRTDRMETAADGGTIVIDFKTGKNAKTADETARSSQLASYQLLISLEDGRRPEGAMLVYPRKETKSVTTLHQGQLTAEQLEEFRATILRTATRIVGPQYAAVATCEGTEYACLCPACRGGEQVV